MGKISLLLEWNSLFLSETLHSEKEWTFHSFAFREYIHLLQILQICIAHLYKYLEKFIIYKLAKSKVYLVKNWHFQLGKFSGIQKKFKLKISAFRKVYSNMSCDKISYPMHF